MGVNTDCIVTCSRTITARWLKRFEREWRKSSYEWLWWMEVRREKGRRQEEEEEKEGGETDNDAVHKMAIAGLQVAAVAVIVVSLIIC